jgi:hypothetical protein
MGCADGLQRSGEHGICRLVHALGLPAEWGDGGTPRVWFPAHAREACSPRPARMRRTRGSAPDASWCSGASDAGMSSRQQAAPPALLGLGYPQPRPWGNPSPARGAQVVIGRAPGCDIVLEHLSISRQHAELTTDLAGNLFLTDLGAGALRALGPRGMQPALPAACSSPNWAPMRCALGPRGPRLLWGQACSRACRARAAAGARHGCGQVVRCIGCTLRALQKPPRRSRSGVHAGHAVQLRHNGW